MFEIVNGLIGDATATVRAAVVLLGVVMVITVWFKTKSFAPTISAIFFGAFMVWGVNNTDVLENVVNDEVEGQAEEHNVDINLGGG
jgi:predicted membrane protein